MTGSWVLIIFILISSIPVIAVFLWFRTSKYQLSLVRFLSALLTGAAALFPALILQNLLIFPDFTKGRAALMYEFFIRIALTEELSRLLMLFIFFLISGFIKPGEGLYQPLTFNIIKKGAAIGLAAGLGFSILESARYAAQNMDIYLLLLRFFTAALHGACGARIGAAALLFRTNPFQAILRIITATVIHGVYNLMLSIPGVTSLAAVIIAISAFITAILTIRGGWSSGTQISAVLNSEDSANNTALH